MDLTTRILLTILLFGIGFLFPPLWIGAAIVGAGVYFDSRPRSLGPTAGRLPYLEEAGDNWLERVRECTESPAEVAFLDAIVKAFDLKPKDNALRGEDLTLRLQVEVLRYRLDFVVDETLVVEIDGAQWHSSPEAVSRDRKRDAALADVGFTILRIPAKIALYDPDKAVQMVRDRRGVARAKHHQESRERQAALRAGMNPVNLIAAASRNASGLANTIARVSAEAAEHAHKQRESLYDVDIINRVRQEQRNLIKQIQMEFPPDPASDNEYLRLGGESDFLTTFDAAPCVAADGIRTVVEEKGKLGSLERYLESLRFYRDLKKELSENPKLKGYFDEAMRRYEEFDAKNAP